MATSSPAASFTWPWLNRLAADDGDPATTADVYELGLLHLGVETTLLEVVRSAVGNPSLPRADLRLHRASSGRPFVTTKQDGTLRELLPIATGPAPVPAGGWLARVLLAGLIGGAGGLGLRGAAPARRG